LTYTFTRLARCWPARHGAVASENPRRNRCFHSSIDKVVRPFSRAPAASARCSTGPPDGTWPVRSAPA